MKFNNNKVQKLFYDEIISTKERIEVKPGKCRYNFRCQMNAVHEAVENDHEKLAMVVYLHDCKCDPIIHFINYHNGEYVDNTLGQWSKNHEYYLIKYVTKDDFFNINYIFDSYRNTIRKQFSWWYRITSDITF